MINAIQYLDIFFSSLSIPAAEVPVVKEEVDKTASWLGMYGISSSSAILTHQSEEKIDLAKCENMFHVCLLFSTKDCIKFYSQSLPLRV